MASVLIQAGHSAQYPPNRAGGGGAPGEADWTTRLAELIALHLEAAGVETVIVGAWLVNGVVGAPPSQVGRDYSLFVSLHYDAAVYGAGRNTGAFADRATGDPLGALADAAIRLWEARWTEETPIPLANARRNPNTSDYHAFRATSARTPGIIIEHGCGAPVPTGGFPPGQDAGYLHDNIGHVAAVDARAILNYLGLEDGEDMARIAELEAEVARLGVVVGERDSTIGYLTNDVERPLRDEVAALKSDKAALEARVAELEAAPAPVTPRPGGVRAARLVLDLADDSSLSLPLGTFVPK